MLTKEKPPLPEGRNRLVRICTWGGIAAVLLAAIVFWLTRDPAETRELRKVERYAEKKDIASLAQAAKNQNAIVARTAVDMLGSVGGDAARTEIERAMTDSRPEVRETAIATYGRVAESGQLRPLEQAWSSPAPADRAAAARALGQTRSWKGLEIVIAGLYDRDPRVRACSYGAIQNILPGMHFTYDPNAGESVRNGQANQIRANLPLLKRAYEEYMRKYPVGSR